MRAALVLLLASALAPGLAQHPPDTTGSIEISVAERRLWVLSPGGDTVFAAPIAVGSGRTLRTQVSTWSFVTPTGVTFVRAKEEAPVWVPPDWHYFEVARSLGLKVVPMKWDEPTPLEDGRQLTIRGGAVGMLDADSVFRVFPADEEIIVDKTLFVPPFGTANRRIAGILGPYRLKLANGVDLHGTPDRKSIGQAATHGCIRLYNEDITWLYHNVPLGTPVVIW